MDVIESISRLNGRHDHKKDASKKLKKFLTSMNEYDKVNELSER